ncbi:MAG TPA: TraR/DksA C4-type zinc finger protein [Bryobacteraceae bacterium]|jgi:DnaK suppressor protein|nr:TraR/DksA C4-type zinc finger protein [Bryobacteraceae bacterium]
MSDPAAVLRQKQKELQSEIARLRAEARGDGEPDVQDETDEAAADESTGETVQEITNASETLEQVEDALKRVAAGTYGKCVVCGRPISAARLEAIPWTPYCLEHQEKLSR